MKVRGRLGVPVQVVSHDRDVIQIFADFLQFKILVVLLFSGKGRSQQISGTQLIQLTPEFRRQSSEICFVLRTPLMDPAFDRIFPVNIYAVKNAGSINIGSEVPGNEGLNAGTNEIAQMIRRSCAGKTIRLSPSPERDKDL